MAYVSIYTLSYARDMLNLWMECERELATGQAKHYRVGSREFTAFDIAEVHKQVQFWADEVAKIEGSARGTRVVRVVPRDL